MPPYLPSIDLQPHFWIFPVENPIIQNNGNKSILICIPSSHKIAINIRQQINIWPYNTHFILKFANKIVTLVDSPKFLCLFYDISHIFWHQKKKSTIFNEGSSTFSCKTQWSFVVSFWM